MYFCVFTSYFLEYMTKKLLLLLFSLNCLILCVFANPVDRQTALGKAGVFIGKDASAVSLRSVGTDAANAPLYIFSRGVGKGFVIVSGDDCLPSILGYTESGDFVESEMPPALIEWLKYYSNIILEAQAQNAPAKIILQPAATRVSVAPMIKTHWTQSAPYNNLCPIITGTTNRALTGCVATAASQVVYFYRKDNPSTLLAKTPTYTYGSAPVTASLPAGTPIKYDLMQTSYSTYPTEMGTAVATLMYAVGTSTWLTYGASTSGQISDLVNTFSSNFNLKSTCLYKSQSSDWDNLVYNEMISGRPTVYAGTSATNGGHAIVCDGYDAGTMMYHFNFGWGGQADGYYTLDDQTGINGFSSSQGMVYGIAPKKPALAVEMEPSDSIYQYLNNPVKIHLANNGTLPYSGVYLFAFESPTKPTSLTSAIAINLSTTVASGESVDLSLPFKPMKKKTYYLFVTDSNLNLLDSVSVPVGTSTPNLKAGDFKVNAGNLKVESKGKTYQIVNNASAVVTAPVLNASDTYFEGLFRFTVGVSSDGSTDSLTTSTKSFTIGFNAKESKTISFVLSDLKPGYHYSVQMANSAYALGVPAPIAFSADSILYFKSQAPDLVVDSVSNRWVKVSGDWNDAYFATLVAAYPNATTMDLTGIIGLNSQPVAVNPNCLFYVAKEVNCSASNLINGDTCLNLKQYRGYDFQPLADFTAKTAAFYPKTTSNVWSTMCLPFRAPVPEGYMVRQLSKHTTSALTFKVVTEVNAGTPCLFMVDASVNDCLTAQNVLVSLQHKNQGDSTFIGAYTALVPATTTRVLNNDAVQYFAAPDGVASIPAFSAYLNIPGVIAKICPTNITTDPLYTLLGQAISSAWQTLSDYRSKATIEAVFKYTTAIQTAEAFYKAQNATLETDVTTATKVLQDARFDLLRSTGKVVDYTSWLVNPSFELKSTKGWTADNILYPSVRALTVLDYYTAGYDGGYLLYIMGKDSIGTNIYQKVSGIPNGKYRVSASLATDYNHSVQLFANAKSVDVAASNFGSYYFNEGSVDTYVTDGTITLGARANGRWYKADNFRLYYLSADTVSSSFRIKSIREENSLKIVGGKGLITIESNKPCRIVVYSITGTIVRQSVVQEDVTNLENLAPGIYLVNGKKVVVW
jgi:hypothetical protein